MVDDGTVERPRHSNRVDINEDRELQYWTEKFGVTRDELIAAVRKVGPLVAELEMHFSGPGAGESLTGIKRK